MSLYGIYKRVIEHYGKRNQLEKSVEELGELIDEVGKVGTRLYSRDNLLMELADVQNMINQLKIIFNFTDEEVEKVMLEKMQRTIERIDKDEL
jgi:NTP pyrophosphatase (non-canonical NTP hydrolase)